MTDLTQELPNMSSHPRVAKHVSHPDNHVILKRASCARFRIYASARNADAVEDYIDPEACKRCSPQDDTSAARSRLRGGLRVCDE